MKKIKILILVIAMSFTGNAFTQTLNWESLKPENKHVLNVNVGWDYGLVWGIGYGYQLDFVLPTVLNIDFSAPAGENLVDDFKVRIGGQVKVVEYNNFAFTANLRGVFRRYENPLVRMVNFGSDFSGVIGYYQPHWFVAGEAGFDKAIVTNFKHSESFKEIYPGVVDGWYEPATAGNFYYGLQTGGSLKQAEMTMAIGYVIQQDFETKPMIPYYARLGFNYKIGK